MFAVPPVYRNGFQDSSRTDADGDTRSHCLHVHNRIPEERMLNSNAHLCSRLHNSHSNPGNAAKYRGLGSGSAIGLRMNIIVHREEQN